MSDNRKLFISVDPSIVELSSFLSKIILGNNFWTYVDGILSKILNRDNFLKKMAKNINHSTIQFLIVAALNPKSNYVRLASQ